MVDHLMQGVSHLRAKEILRLLRSFGPVQPRAFSETNLTGRDDFSDQRELQPAALPGLWEPRQRGRFPSYSKRHLMCGVNDGCCQQGQILV